VVEGDEHLRSASTNLLAVEVAARQGEANVKAMRELFRSIHTIKGLSAMVAVEPIVTIAHRMETALRGANQFGGKLSLESIDTLLQGVEAIGLRLRQVSERKPVEPPPAALLVRLEAVDTEVPEAAPALNLGLEPSLAAKLAPLEQQQLESGLASGHRAVRAEFVPSSEAAARGFNITSVREAVGKLGEIVKVMPVSGPKGLVFVLLVLTRETDEAIASAAGIERSAISVVGEPRPAPVKFLEHSAADEGSSTEGWGIVRVEVSRLDETMERLSSLIVTRFRFAAAVARLTHAGADTRELLQILQDNGRQLRDMRASILRARMVSVAEVLERVPLLVRGLKRTMGKQVRLEMDVGKAELDKAVAERLFPAIVQLVRNAVDHAIEMPDERKAAGKPEEGVIRISCTERSNTRVELVVSDDGRGIDAAKVARRAGREVPANDAGLLELLCVAGLSTRDEPSLTSGRGMGMDIVRQVAVTQLGGALTLATVPGQSTTFTLRVPVTISIVDAFSLECGGQRFLVPVGAVEEILEIDADKVIRSPNGAKRGGRSVAMLERRGEAIPMLSLGALFSSGNGEDARKALVIRQGGVPMAFAVDRMLGQHEVVVRPLEDPLLKVLGVSGSTDLGDGKPTLMLDLLSLTTHLLAQASAKTEAVQ
jgi:two-component system, chemotaxis family, sensor kinase CheA